MPDITVISSDLDGADLRRKQRGRFVRCYGRRDEEDIQDAVNTAHRGRQFVLRGDDWDRIFGAKPGEPVDGSQDRVD